MTTTTSAAGTVAEQVLGWDHLEWWVGNARAFTALLCAGFGFEVDAYCGPETGVSDHVSYGLRQGDIRFVVTSGLEPDCEVARHVLRHGDGVRSLAWRVADPGRALEAAAERGARIVNEPNEDVGPWGRRTRAAIGAYGETNIVFVGPSTTASTAAVRLPGNAPGPPVGLSRIDHVVGNVAEGELDKWVAWFEEVLGFAEMRHFDAEQISTRYSALRSTVVHADGRVVLPINEPAPGLKESQIAEYLEAYEGAGVQHVALATDDIVTAVDAMARRGLRFLEMPPTYYEDARARCAEFEVPWTDLERLGIEIDKEAGGYLLQIFTENLTDRPTVFVEIIERAGAAGFGEGNFKALFEAIEREQARRGHL